MKLIQTQQVIDIRYGRLHKINVWNLKKDTWEMIGDYFNEDFSSSKQTWSTWYFFF